MSKPTELIGLSLSKFTELIDSKKELHVQPTRLIPFHKPKSEMALASVFLSALRLVKKFRRNLFTTTGMSNQPGLRFYTEAEFVLYEKQRVDGLILVISKGVIADAMLLEIKSGTKDLDKSQIENYLDIAVGYGIPKLITVSNQFVTFPTQSPLDKLGIKRPKSVSMYHFSWTSMLTTATLLLEDSDNGIADQGQTEIMREVLHYLQSEQSGVAGFTQMKEGWRDFIKKISDGDSLNAGDNCVEETVDSWFQEERDMSLLLSRKLNLSVKIVGQAKKYAKDLAARTEDEKKKLITDKVLKSRLKINGVVSDLEIKALFQRKSIEMSVNLAAPQDKKTSSGKLNWLRKQLEGARKKNPDLYQKMVLNLCVDVSIKSLKGYDRLRLEEWDESLENLRSGEIKEFKILFFKNLGNNFASRKKVVVAIEQMLLDYYQGIVEHLRAWQKPAPQIKEKENAVASEGFSFGGA